MAKKRVIFEWFGDQFKAEMEKRAKVALLKAAADLQQRSADEAPIDLGDLRGNAQTDESLLDSRLTVLVGYSLPYALRQHEELDYVHPKGGKAKFLEDPFRANQLRYLNFIQDEVFRVNS